ncbi:hypothetical protein PINS_up019985 [Pythium insidiosum]|nr:hypothetical protein PINS_up019985 [Pythium insidiosum]
MNESYEAAIATEGRSSGSVSEDQWIAWDERLALAPDLAAKKALVTGADGVMADATYRAVWFPLMEAQELLDDATPDALARADQVLHAAALEHPTQLRVLQKSGMYKRAARLSKRHALLSLEVAIQRKAADIVIQVFLQRLTMPHHHKNHELKH